MSKEELDELGWIPFQFTLKSDITTYLEADNDLIKLLEPPDLQEVIDAIGEHDNDDFTGMIKVRVSLSVYEHWKETYASLTGDTDDERILSLLYGYESQR
jgi:hypothetical protein